MRAAFVGHEEVALKPVFEKLGGRIGYGKLKAEDVVAALATDEVEEMMAGSTPLMARDEGKDHDDDVGNALRSPTKTMGLFFDHPLASSAPQPNDNIDRCDSFTMDVTQPRYFSPLHIMESIDASKDNIVLATSFVNADPLRKTCTYEELGRAAFGSTGRLAVLISLACVLLLPPHSRTMSVWPRHWKYTR